MAKLENDKDEITAIGKNLFFHDFSNILSLQNMYYLLYYLGRILIEFKEKV
ncbi:hypothetical protein NCCP28_39830 [Niallia sp. NCCP-28]|nr:hypothetical protein NCCP28_39830 [Niallia sp. NCCP-28]